jgi:ribose transport system substrate-binding protein
MRKILPAILLMACSALVGCANGGGAGDDELVVGYAGAIQSNPNNKAVEDGLRVKVEEAGGRLIVTDAQFQADKQLTDVRSLISQQVDVLVVWPIDPRGLQPAIAAADEAGIPVIVQDTAQGGPYAVNFAGSDHDSAAEAAGLIAGEVGEGAGVVQIEGVPVVGVLDARNKGFAAGAEKHGLDLLAHQINDKDSADGARPIVDAWKSRFGSDIKAIFAYNDPSALGAASAVGGGFKPVVVGMNGSAEGVQAVRDGRLLATFDFHPVEVGMGLGWAAVQIAAGETLPETVQTTSTMITADNVGEWIPVEEALKRKTEVKVVDGVLEVTPAS